MTKVGLQRSWLCLHTPGSWKRFKESTIDLPDLFDAQDVTSNQFSGSKRAWIDGWPEWGICRMFLCNWPCLANWYGTCADIFHCFLRTKSPGSESNKSTPSWTKTCTPSVGPRTGSPDPRDPTTAVLVPTRSMAVTSSRLTTELASTPVSTSQEQMPKSCPPSGSSRSDPVRASAWETISGWDVSCSTVLQKTSVPSFPSTLSPCRYYPHFICLVLKNARINSPFSL